MEAQDIQNMIAQGIATALAGIQQQQQPPARDYFGEAEALRKQADALRKQGVSQLAVTDDETFAKIRESIVTGVATEATKQIDKAGGTRLSDEQKAEKKLAKEEHKAKINDEKFKANIAEIILSEETELESFKQSLPDTKGRVKKTLTW